MERVGLGLQDLYQALRRRKLILLLAALVGGALTVAISNGIPVHYTSEGLLEVEGHSPLMKELNPVADPTTPDQVRTEVDILQSRAVADAVVRTLNLAAAPDFKEALRDPTWIDRVHTGLEDVSSRVQEFLGMNTSVDKVVVARELFQKRLEVLANEKSHIVAVRFKTGSPDLSAKVVNTLLAEYLNRQVAANVSVSEQENQWLTKHLTELQQAVDDAARRAQDFRDASGVVDIQAGALPAVQLNERELALSNARQDLAKAEVAYDTAAKSFQGGSGFSGQEALGSLVIQRLLGQQADILQRIANLRQRGGENSMYLPPVQAELASVRQQLSSETAKIVVSLRREVELARDRVRTLEAAVTDSQARARQNVAAAATLAQLNHEVEAKRHVYIAFLTRMEQTQLASTQFPTARVVSPAAPPPQADGLPTWLATVLGVIAAEFFAVAFILLRMVLRGKITSAKDLELLMGIPPIGSIPSLPGPGGMPIAMRILDMTQSGTVETLHALRFAVLGMNRGAASTCLLVTSSRPGEGKSTLAASFARLSAASGLRVLLIEADLRRPGLSRMFRTSTKVGIESVLSHGVRLVDAVYTDQKSGLNCLLANGSTANPVAALQSVEFAELMAESLRSYDLVIVDSPPVMNVVDALILSRYSNVILFAVECGRTAASTVAEAVRRFPKDVQSQIATVLTRVPQSEEDWRGYYSGYKGAGYKGKLLPTT
jgi:succinoglycan biosynthesis transport protein ExoP